MARRKAADCDSQDINFRMAEEWQRFESGIDEKLADVFDFPASAASPSRLDTERDLLLSSRLAQ